MRLACFQSSCWVSTHDIALCVHFDPISDSGIRSRKHAPVDEGLGTIAFKDVECVAAKEMMAVVS